MKPKLPRVVFAVLVVTALFWAAGWDFNERGSTAFSYVLALVLCGTGLTYW